MHESPTRARQHQKGHRRKAVALLASAACLASVAAAASITDPLGTATLPTPKTPAHELRIERTQAGREGLELAARLSETSNLIMLPVGWTVRRAVAANPERGETILKREAPVTDLRLEPGDYVVEAAYGHVKVAHSVRVEPGRVVGVTLILNVGGIRALSTLATLGMPAGVTASHRVYALSGPAAGHEIAAGVGQGELLRVAAGAYRIESRFSPGNAVAEAKVSVKPGILSGVEIAHIAGVARIDIDEGGDDTVWEVRGEKGEWLAAGRGNHPNLVLAPGAYAVAATIAGKRHSLSFSVAPETTTHVKLAE